jgi:hypothetical protein
MVQINGGWQSNDHWIAPNSTIKAMICRTILFEIDFIEIMMLNSYGGPLLARLEDRG